MASETRPLAPGRAATWLQIVKTCGCDETVDPDPIARWLLITRACVFPMTITAVAIGGLLAAPHPGFDAALFALAAIGSVIAHAANNVMNDLFDLRSGLDTAAYPRAQYAPHPVLSGLIDRTGLGRLALGLNLADAAIMVVLVVERDLGIAAFALGGLLLSVGYVAPPLRLKARGLGEPSVLLIWGPVMVGGIYYAATGEVSGSALWASIPYGLLATTVLLGKHIDKLPWDRAAGVSTLPVLLGEDRARKATVGIMGLFYAAVIALVLTGTTTVWPLAALAGLPTLAKTRRRFGRPKPNDPPRGYPIWPLWFGPLAFVHARVAGSLFVGGLLLGVLWKVSL